MITKIMFNTGAIAPMIDLLTKLLKKVPKRSNQGFTLIELLVAMVIATIVITPLLGFMADILNRDRIEQAKATSEAEIQAAIDYIAQDLEQAIYIYNATALNAISTIDPATSGIKDQIPPVATPTSTVCGDVTKCFPVLVFWKRETVKDVLSISGITKDPDDPDTTDDTFVYSLVAYYLIKGNTGSGNWSDMARIGRFQIKDGVIDPNDPTTPGTPPTTKYARAIDSGYKGFDLTLPGSTLGDKMNLWKKDGTYTNDVLTLIDYVDKGTTAPTQNCPTNTQRIPPLPTTATNPETGFYACVDSTSTLAQVFIRGNALARINNTNSYNAGNSTYFPTASVQVKGRGFLGVN